MRQRAEKVVRFFVRAGGRIDGVRLASPSWSILTAAQREPDMPVVTSVTAGTGPANEIIG